MSDKIYLKEITLPIVETGENETYSFVQTDADLDTAGDAADAKAVGDEISALKQDFNEYHPDLGSGYSAQLLSTVFIEDEVPYNFRTSGGSADIGDREYDEIVGASLVVNQMVYPPASGSTTSAGITYTYDGNGRTTCSGTLTDSWSYGAVSQTSFSFVKGHKYILTGCPKDGSESWLRLCVNSVTAFPAGHRLFDDGRGKILDALVDESSVSANVMIGSAYTGDISKVVFVPQLFDLTLMLGTQIADYVYGLDQSTAGSGVTWLKHHFPKIFDSGYIPYNAGEMQSVSGLSAHRMTGFNQWDEEWESGRINVTTGEDSTGNGIRSKNMIPVFPSTTYHAVSGSYTGATSILICYYDASENYISYENKNGLSVNFTTPSDAHYIRFNVQTSAAVTYKNDICINLHWDGERDGEYEEYEEHIYELDSDIELRGIPKLDSANNLYYDGDTYESDGTVTRNVDFITIDGSENWVQGSSNANTFYTAPARSVMRYKYRGDMMCYGGYPFMGFTSSGYSNFIGNQNGMCAFSPAGTDYSTISEIAFKDITCSTLEEWKAKLASNPLTVVYELATPTTETAEPYQNPQIVDDFGTEEYVTTSIVPVGHVTKYQPNLRAKLEMSPDSPEEDGDYIVRHNNGENQYVALGSTTTIQGILDRLTALENA